MSYVKIGDVLRRHRLDPQFIERDRLTQKELAHMIGCHDSVVSRVERDDQSPTSDYLQRFIEVLNLPDDQVKELWDLVKKSSGNVSTFQPTQHQEDWGEALDVVLRGRRKELALLKQWIDDRNRLIAVLGLGGIGKTALATELARQIKDDFEYIIWRSLRNAPPLEEILVDCIKLFTNQQVTDLPAKESRQVSFFIDYLRQHRCLIILDNAETILRSDRAGYYLDGYENFGEFIQRVGLTAHQSCFILTSREKPVEFSLMQGKTSPVRVMQLRGLESKEGQEILEDFGLSGSPEELGLLVERYAGSPLALKLASATIETLYSGDVPSFLRDTITAVGYVRDPLEQQFARLSDLEQDIIYWLAIEREPVTFSEIRKDLVKSVSDDELLNALQFLQRRSMIETSYTLFTLHPVVMEYTSNQLVDQISQEISTTEINLLKSHALIKAQTKGYIRESQYRFILKPIINKLLNRFSNTELDGNISSILADLREMPSPVSSYAGGNILNLLVYLNERWT